MAGPARGIAVPGGLDAQGLPLGRQHHRAAVSTRKGPVLHSAEVIEQGGRTLSRRRRWWAALERPV